MLASLIHHYRHVVQVCSIELRSPIPAVIQPAPCCQSINAWRSALTSFKKVVDLLAHHLGSCVLHPRLLSDACLMMTYLQLVNDFLEVIDYAILLSDGLPADTHVG